MPFRRTLKLFKAGKLRGLALTGDKRVTEMPDVPTFTESGLPTYNRHGGTEGHCGIDRRALAEGPLPDSARARVAAAVDR
jgi:tripartite-type tricarboxylate transporter receptor subunit TctC